MCEKEAEQKSLGRERVGEEEKKGEREREET